MELKYKYHMGRWLFMGYCLEKDNLISKTKVIVNFNLVFAYDKTNHIFS